MIERKTEKKRERDNDKEGKQWAEVKPCTYIAHLDFHT